MPAIPLVAVWTLDKDGAITQTLCKYLPSNVIESNSSSCKNTQMKGCLWSKGAHHSLPYMYIVYMMDNEAALYLYASESSPLLRSC